MHSPDAASPGSSAVPLVRHSPLSAAQPPVTVIFTVAPPAYVRLEDCTDGWEDLVPDAA